MRAVSRRQLTLAVTCIAVLALSLATAAQRLGAAEPDEGRATLPLQELLRLNREAEANARAVDKPPPVAGTVDRAQFDGRLLDDALELTARFDVTVLEDDDWVEVPLLQVTPGMHVTGLPDVEGVSFVLAEGRLSLVTRLAGRYGFELGILQDAVAEGDTRIVQVQAPVSTLVTLRVAFDHALFDLLSAGAASDATGVLLYPREGELEVRWRRLVAVEERPVPAVEVRRPLVTAAHASVVSTLGAPRVTRIVYEMRLTGEQAVVLTLPPQQMLEEVYLNGVRTPFEPDGRKVELTVHPLRSGDEHAALELLITSPRDNYLLSGRVDFDVPAIDWPINELFVDLHLPSVFSYDWAGGSLAPAEKSPRIEYANDIPTPGKTLAVHQVLIAEMAPSVRVAYAIDLEGRYFTE